MVCRCTDIINCVYDMAKIDKIRAVISAIERSNDSVSQHLNSLAFDCEGTFCCDNISELNFEEKTLNKDMIKGLPEMVQKCACKIDQLQEEYNSMTKEDTEYHHKQTLNNNK